ncbi:hypothetical protein TNCV_2751221 [Trichonephila clavipes]|nr:hypothetical protein TNCV_2751221 [Trichonephila clavipes]
MNEITQQEKTTHFSSRNEQQERNNSTQQEKTTQLVSRNEQTQLCTVVNRLHRLYSRIGFFYLLTHAETGLQQNGTRSSLATNPDSIAARMKIVFVCGDPGRTPQSCLCFTATHCSHSWCDGIMSHCPQCTVTHSIDTGCHDCPVACPSHPTATCVVTPALLGLPKQRYHKTVPALLLLFLVLPDHQICLKSSISTII